MSDLLGEPHRLLGELADLERGSRSPDRHAPRDQGVRQRRWVTDACRDRDRLGAQLVTLARSGFVAPGSREDVRAAGTRRVAVVARQCLECFAQQRDDLLSVPARNQGNRPP